MCFTRNDHNLTPADSPPPDGERRHVQREASEEGS